MSFKTHACVTAHCAVGEPGCYGVFKGYEDEFTVHFESVEDAIKSVTSTEDLDDQAWSMINDHLHCPNCACARGGHALTEEIGDYRYCRCGSHHSRVAS